MKELVLVAVPAPVVTWTGPVVAPAGTWVVICVDVSTLMGASMPLKVTLIAPNKEVPLTTTFLPTSPERGVNFVIVGGGVVATVNGSLLVAVPPGPVTWTYPFVAPGGTEVMIFVDVSLLTTAETPSKLTPVGPKALIRLVPVMVTLVPTYPDFGLIFLMTGGGVGIPCPMRVWSTPDGSSIP